MHGDLLPAGFQLSGSGLINPVVGRRSGLINCYMKGGALDPVI